MLSVPSNANYLSPLGFKFTLARTPNMNFTVQQATIPFIQLSQPFVPTPFTRLPQTGKIDYGQFSLTFIIDDNMTNYLEIYNWLHGLGFPEKFDQFKALKTGDPKGKEVSDMNLMILNSHSRPNISIDFEGAFPISLSEVILSTTDSDVIYAKATVIFEYVLFKIRNV